MKPMRKAISSGQPTCRPWRSCTVSTKVAACSSEPGVPASSRPEGLIAVFPHMLSRGVPDIDGQSILVDIPWDMPELVRLSMPLPRDLFGFLHEAISRFFL